MSGQAKLLACTVSHVIVEIRGKDVESCFLEDLPFGWNLAGPGNKVKMRVTEKSL
jgi:hypothetical protein